MERNGKTVLQLRTERNGTERDGTRTERERNDKKEQERIDLAEGPRSRTERNYFKKVGTCPALVYSPFNLINWNIVYSPFNQIDWNIGLDNDINYNRNLVT